MTSITEYGDKRVEAAIAEERRLIVAAMNDWAERRSGIVRSAVEGWAGVIERGEYRKGAGE